MVKGLDDQAVAIGYAFGLTAMEVASWPSSRAHNPGDKTGSHWITRQGHLWKRDSAWGDGTGAAGRHLARSVGG